MDVRNAVFRHIAGPVGGVLQAPQHAGSCCRGITNDVGQVQQAVSETLGDLLRESLALVGYVGLLFYYDARLALVCLTGAPLVLLSAGAAGPAAARRPRGAARRTLEHMSHVAPRRSRGTGSSRRSAPRTGRPSGSAARPARCTGPT